MLTAQGCRLRRERLWKVLSGEIEWVLIADPRHVHYFANFWINPFSFSAGERAFLVLDRTGKATLICDNFARRSAPSESFVDDEIVGKWYDHRHSVVNRDALLVATLERVKDRLTPDRGLVEESALPLSALAALDTAPAAEGGELGSIIRSLRRKKETDEISLLQRCLRAAEAGHARALEVVRPGVSELDVYREVQSASLEAAGRPVLLYGDFRASTPARPKVGGLPTTYKLQDGDLFLLDFSVVMDGYRGRHDKYDSCRKTPTRESVGDVRAMPFRSTERAKAHWLRVRRPAGSMRLFRRNWKWPAMVPWLTTQGTGSVLPTRSLLSWCRRVRMNWPRETW